MGLSSKTKVISGLALVSAIVAGCGGGGGSSTPASTPAGQTSGSQTSGGQTPASTVLTQGTTACAAIASPDTVGSASPALLGSCEQYEASRFPTRSASEFKNPGSGIKPLSFNGAAGYEIDLGTLSSKIVVPSATQSDLSSTFGNYAGKRFRTTQGDAFADVYDFRNTLAVPSALPVLDLNYSRFGVFSRFTNLTQGYYGGWAQGDTQGNLPSASKQFSGRIIGVVGPSSTSTAAGAVVGYSADVVLTVDFAASGSAVVKSLFISNFGYTVAGTVAAAPSIASGTATATTVNLDKTAKSLSVLFQVPASVAGSNAIGQGNLVGSFYAASGTVEVTEFTGTVKFTTADGRNAIGGFGLRSGAMTGP
jgi:hypothetical protein